MSIFRPPRLFHGHFMRLPYNLNGKHFRVTNSYETRYPHFGNLRELILIAIVLLLLVGLFILFGMWENAPQSPSNIWPPSICLGWPISS